MMATLAAAFAAARVVLGTCVAEGQSAGGEGEKATPADKGASPGDKGASPAGQAAVSAVSPAAEEAPRPGRVKLVYSLGPGTRGCDDEAFFRRMVASELEEPDPFVLVGTATHELDVHIQKDAPGFRATVRLRDIRQSPSGDVRQSLPGGAGKEVYARDFLERTCADAVDRAVIVSMLTVFPPARQTGPPAATAPPAAGPAAAPAGELERRIGVLETRAKVQGERLDRLEARLEDLEKARTIKDEKARRTKMDITWALSAGALITANLTPDVGPGVWLAGGGRSGPISVELEARVVVPWRVTVGADHFDFSEYVGFLVPCGHYSYFFGCAVAGGGTSLIYGAELPANKTAIREILQLGGRLGAEIPFGDSIFGARAWGEVLYAMPPNTTHIHPAETSWERQQVSAFFGLGLVIKLNEEGTR